MFDNLSSPASPSTGESTDLYLSSSTDADRPRRAHGLAGIYGFWTGLRTALSTDRTVYGHLSTDIIVYGH